jgi:hypothetical protein
LFEYELEGYFLMVNGDFTRGSAALQHYRMRDKHGDNTATAITRNAIIWGTENPHVSHELELATPKVNVCCGVTRDKMYGSFIFAEETVRAASYLDMLQEFVFLQLTQTGTLDTITFQYDGAPRGSF